MFIHLGDDVIIPKKDIVVILDIKSNHSAATKDFITGARQRDLMIHIADPKKGKTYVITTNNVYVSPISCSTLKKRALIHLKPGLN